ncbi:MAG: hypothetical protein NTY05_16180 [Rhodocyclales bacterium]|nr:hypothetical protein [Rhodocyclales bacterium]
MALFLLLIILLAIAWGVADFQLQSRIERAPPPLPVPKAAPAASPKAELVPPVETAPVVAQNPPTGSAGATADSEPALPRQDSRTTTPEADKTPQSGQLHLDSGSQSEQ